MNGDPKTVRELYFWMKGKFDELGERIDNTRRVTFWIGGISGGIIGGVIIGLVKLFGGR